MDFLTSSFVYILILLEYIYATSDPIYLNSWAVKIEGGERRARDIANKHGFVYVHKILDDHYLFDHHHVNKRSTYTSQFHHTLLSTEKEVLWHEQQVVRRRVKRDIYNNNNYNDPKWPRMWYLNRKGQPNMNVEPAWAKGYTGKRVVVSILDDGIEKDHPDLKKNYDPAASYDVNGRDDDPQPRYDFSNENRHGTRCAGEVAAEANNNECSVGIAYDAKIGGVRMLDGDVTDSVEAVSLSLYRQHIDIYSASWGPDDDGRTVDGPATLARQSFYDGVNKGRGGLGSIFVWASGNGGRSGDSCNCDGYTNSIYTLSISSATERGDIPWYSEACSSTLATTYSSGIGGEKQIITTDINHRCTERHTGTSASSPLAAGTIALALEANPNLTWRDMQHIVVRTAKKSNLRARDWKLNAVGRYVSHAFGYGLMDASAMVDLALNWTTVPPQHLCEINSNEEWVIPQNGKRQFPLYSDGCKKDRNSHVHFLEHVQAKITLTSSRRGEVSLYLVSPQGTNSTLLSKRVRDTSRDGFTKWEFMTTHTWGEIAVGTWTLYVNNGASSSRPVNVKRVVLMMYGTDVHPEMKMTTTTTTQKPAIKTPATKKPSDNKRRKHVNSHYPPKNFPVPRKDQIYSQCSLKLHTKLYPILTTRKFYGATTVKPNRKKFAKHKQNRIDVTTKPKPVLETPPMNRSATSAVLKSWTLVLRGTAPEDGNPNGSHRTGGKNNPNGVANQQFEVPAGGDGAQSVGATEPLGGCSKSGVSGQCLECPRGQFLVDGSCVRKCPAGFFGLVEDNHGKTKAVCNKCNEACLTCHGPSLHECFSCQRDWVRNGTTCMSTFFIQPDQVKYLMIGVAAFCGFVLIIVAIFLIIRTCRRRREKGREGAKSAHIDYHNVPNGSDKNLLDYCSDSDSDLETTKMPQIQIARI